MPGLLYPIVCLSFVHSKRLDTNEYVEAFLADASLFWVRCLDFPPSLPPSSLRCSWECRRKVSCVTLRWWGRTEGFPVDAWSSMTLAFILARCLLPCHEASARGFHSHWPRAWVCICLSQLGHSGLFLTNQAPLLSFLCPLPWGLPCNQATCPSSKSHPQGRAQYLSSSPSDMLPITTWRGCRELWAPSLPCVELLYKMWQLVKFKFQINNE